ncbi:MAG TPA: MltA domain-containing protein [Aestuariivirga sp.]|nr:MltA domain-containing protein [Aestuariivirga sp.]
MIGRLGLACLFAISFAMTAEAKPVLTAVPFAQIESWAADDHAAALAAFQRSCDEILASGHGFERNVRFGGRREDWLDVCEKALQSKSARQFFEEQFAALRVTDPVRPEGLFTGYYEPEAEGSRTAGNGYGVPIYRKPDDLVSFDRATEKQINLKYGRMVQGRPAGYFTRREIEEGALRGRGFEIVWLKSWVDAFFIHVQGSGRIRFEDGSTMRLAYGAKTGQPYTGIGGLLVERGVLTRANMSMQALRKWMKNNPRSARELMWENKSFVFFREVKVDDPSLGAPGAQKVPLTPLRSMAVDRSLWMFGTPIWLDAKVPSGAAGEMQSFRHLMIAQDTGTAIKGHVRGDVYWGWGEKAALIAGHMKSPGSMIVLLPKKLGLRLLNER